MSGVYFLGIAGAGVSALASVLKSRGVNVSGSDSGVFPPISDYLTEQGIPWRDGFDAALIPEDIDAAVIGSSAKLDLATNPELAALKARGVPLYSFAEYLAAHTRGRDNLLVVGSFGKSTLAALIAVLLREAGRDPGYFIGAAPLDLPASGHDGTDPQFVIEGDEYILSPDDRRPKFALYEPSSLLISSLVHDHLNVYPTPESYEKPFADLIGRLAPETLLVCARGFPALERLTKGRAVVWYGREPGPGYWADRIVIGEITRFDLVTPAGDRIPLETELLGLHNIENLVGAAALLLERGLITPEALQAGARRFCGVARRLDRKTTASPVPVYEGFGSSYEKARSAIEAVQLHFPDRRLVVIFEPHTFSWRNRASLEWYDTVFAGVREVLLLPPPGHGAAGHDQLDTGEIAARIKGPAVHPMEDGQAVLAWAGENLRAGDVVLLLSSGPLDGLAKTLPAMLDGR